MISRSPNGRGIRFTRGDIDAEDRAYTLVTVSPPMQRPRVIHGETTRCRFVQLVCGPLLIMHLSPVKAPAYQAGAGI